MQIEEVKAKIRGNPIAAAMLKGPQAILDRVRAPGDTPPPDLPGSLAPQALTPAGKSGKERAHGARQAAS